MSEVKAKCYQQNFDMCHTCKTFLDRTDSHLANFHQMTRRSSEFLRAYEKSRNVKSELALNLNYIVQRSQ